MSTLSSLKELPPFALAKGGSFILSKSFCYGENSVRQNKVT